MATIIDIGRGRIRVRLGAFFGTTLYFVCKRTNGPLEGANGLEPVMPDTIPAERDCEPRARTNNPAVVPDEPAAAYELGYTDGRRLMSAADRADASLDPVRARYLALADAVQPSPAGQAYLAGVRDAAADNLPAPPLEHRHAA